MLAAGFGCLAPGLSAAQEIAFPGIAWGEAAESVRARMVAGGYAFQHVLEGGDHLYVRLADSAWVRVDLRGGRVVGAALVDPARGVDAGARYQALADSLRAARGEPDEVGRDAGRELVWMSGLASLALSVRGGGGLRQVELVWRGAGWYDEMARRMEERPVPEGYTIVSASQYLRIAIDTTVTGPRGGEGVRGRFRMEYRQPITPSVAGVAQDPIDVVEYEMDFDCGGGRTRLVARTTYLEGRRLSSSRPEGQPWTVPQPDGHYARGRDLVCRAARRGRA